MSGRKQGGKLMVYGRKERSWSCTLSGGVAVWYTVGV